MIEREWRPDDPSDPEGNCQLYVGAFSVGGVAVSEGTHFAWQADGGYEQCESMEEARAWVEVVS